MGVVYLAEDTTLNRRVAIKVMGASVASGRSFLVLGFFVVLLVASAHVSLGGKPILGKALLDDRAGGTRP
jgi:hypothetical protein